MAENGVSDAELIAQALALTGVDDDARWDRVCELHGRGGQQIFIAARDLCASPVPRDRRLGADILGQLGYRLGRPFLEESLPILMGLCERDTDIEALDAALAAIGHLHDPRALDAVLRFVDHDSADLRLSAAIALHCVVGDEGQEDPRGVEALIALTRDEDEDVRDWATFGLGRQLELDTPEVRQALADRLDDPHADVVAEAVAGLARRRDGRAAQAVRRLLAEDDVHVLVVEAAEELADPGLTAALAALQTAGWARTDFERRVLQDALDECAAG